MDTFHALNWSDVAVRVRTVEDAWNGRDASALVALFSEDCHWRIGAGSPTGRREILDHVVLEAAGRLGHRILYELKMVHGGSVTLASIREWHDHTGAWFRETGSEIWRFNNRGQVQSRQADATPTLIAEARRTLRWPPGPRARGALA